MISIIIPMYNFGKLGDYCFIKCLDSIRNQSFTNYEVLLMENLSKDDTREAIQEYLDKIKDSRFKLFILDKPGLTNARNEGIKHSSGEYITFIDGDDFISQDYLQTGYNLISKENADMLIYNWAFYYYNNGKIKDMTHFQNNVFIRDNKDQRIYTALAWAKLIKKQLLIDNNISFDKSLTGGEDTLFGVDVYFASKKIITAENGKYFYTQNRKNQTTYTMKDTVAISTVKAIIKIKDVYKKYNVLQDNELFYNQEIVNLMIGYPLGNTQIRKIKKSTLDSIISQLKDTILNINVDNNSYKEWQKIWFKRFQKSVKGGYSYYFIKLIKLYRNIFIKPFKIKWYK